MAVFSSIWQHLIKVLQLQIILVVAADSASAHHYLAVCCAAFARAHTGSGPDRDVLLAMQF